MTVGALNKLDAGRQVFGLRVASVEILKEHTWPFVSWIPVSVTLGEPCTQRSESQSVRSDCGEALRGWLQASNGHVPLLGCQKDLSLCDVQRKIPQ